MAQPNMQLDNGMSTMPPRTPHNAPNDAELAMARRIKALMSLQNRTMRDLEKARSLPYRTIQSYLQGKVRPPARFILEVADWLDVSPEFVLTGCGAVFDHKILAKTLAELDKTRESMEARTNNRVQLDSLAGVFVAFYQSHYTANRANGTDAPEAFRPGPLAWNTTQIEEVENAHLTEPSAADLPDPPPT